MARCLQFDDQDKQRCARSTTDFAISADGETATVAGEMEVEIIRPADDGGAQFWLENMENEMTKRQMQGCEVLEIDGVDPKRALFELRDGKFWDGEPATRKEDGTRPRKMGSTSSSWTMGGASSTTTSTALTRAL